MSLPKSFAQELSDIAVKNRELKCGQLRLWRELCRTSARKGKYSCVLLQRRYVVAHLFSSWKIQDLLREFAEPIALLKKHGVKVSAVQPRCKCKENLQKARHEIRLIATWPEG